MGNPNLKYSLTCIRKDNRRMKFRPIRAARRSRAIKLDARNGGDPPGRIHVFNDRA